MRLSPIRRPTSSRLAVAGALSLFVALLAPPARAQFAWPSPDQADMPVDAATRSTVVDSLAAALERRYVFPDVARATAAALRARLRKGAYAGLDSAQAFADSLSHDLRAIGKDHHFRVLYYQRSLPESAFTPRGPSAEERALAQRQARYRNYGFDRIQRLPGNVGYLDLRVFDGSPEGGALAQAAMALLGNSDALIVDLRRNGGGDPNMIVLLLSWLFSADDRVHVNDFYFREGNRTEQFWTLTTIPGPRYTGKDVYVLTSRRTGSAAEEFAYDLKNLKRATLVGETTSGGANPGGLARLTAHFAAFVSDGRAINPISKANWEGVGVEPDIKVSADEALKTAQVAAVRGLLERETDPDRRPMLERALQAAKDAPIEPLDLGGPRPTARAGN